MKKIIFVLILGIIIGGLLFYIMIGQPETKKDIIIETITKIDSSEIVKLQDSLLILQDELGLKPKIIELPVITIHDTIIDTLTIYPIGSTKLITKIIPFNFTTEAEDSISFNVKLKQEISVWTSYRLAKYFIDTETDAQITDFVLKSKLRIVPIQEDRKLFKIVCSGGFYWGEKDYMLNLGFGASWKDRFDILINATSQKQMGISLNYRLGG